jgi:hypothetical protein
LVKRAHSVGKKQAKGKKGPPVREPGPKSPPKKARRRR